MQILAAKTEKKKWYVMPEGKSALDEFEVGESMFGRKVETVSYLDAKAVEVIGDLEEACRVADTLRVIWQVVRTMRN